MLLTDGARGMPRRLLVRIGIGIEIGNGNGTDDCGMSESHGNLQGAETGEEVKQVEEHFGSVCPAFV